jgi:hypothetical protein
LFSDKSKDYTILLPVRAEGLNLRILIDESKINLFKKNHLKVPDKIKNHMIKFNKCVISGIAYMREGYLAVLTFGVSKKNSRI